MSNEVVLTTPLDAQIVEVKDTDEWRREKITFNGADNPRAIAYLYLPKNYPGPAQVVNIVPAGDVAFFTCGIPLCSGCDRLSVR